MSRRDVVEELEKRRSPGARPGRGVADLPSNSNQRLHDETPKSQNRHTILPNPIDQPKEIGEILQVHKLVSLPNGWPLACRSGRISLLKFRSRSQGTGACRRHHQLPDSAG